VKNKTTAQFDSAENWAVEFYSESNLCRVENVGANFPGAI
jgi:hypothetical protein